MLITIFEIKLDNFYYIPTNTLTISFSLERTDCFLASLSPPTRLVGGNTSSNSVPPWATYPLLIDFSINFLDFSFRFSSEISSFIFYSFSILAYS